MFTATCKHCGQKIASAEGEFYMHPVMDNLLRYGGLSRCQTGGKPYGFNAEPIGTPCSPPCYGEFQPDENEILTDGEED